MLFPQEFFNYSFIPSLLSEREFGVSPKTWDALKLSSGLAAVSGPNRLSRVGLVSWGFAGASSENSPAARDAGVDRTASPADSEAPASAPASPSAALAVRVSSSTLSAADSA